MEHTQQQYCLRWNNHHSNLLTVFQDLLQSEVFADVTLVCDGGNPIKCHRMVLAACSPYFQNLFKDLPCTKPVVVLKDIKYIEIKAILQYMYRGEVNVAQDHLAAMLKVAEALRVKGLVEEEKSCKSSSEEPHSMDHHPRSPSPISTSNDQTIHSNTVHNTCISNSPTPPPPPLHPSSLMYSPAYERKASEYTNINIPLWATLPGLPPLPPHTPSLPTNASNHRQMAAMLSGAYNVAGTDLSPLKKKKLSSLQFQGEPPMDTPILRTVLGQGQADNSQSAGLANCHSDNGESMIDGNHSDRSSATSSGADDRKTNRLRNEPLEDAQSPYTDFMDQSVSNDEDDKSKLAIPSSSPQSLNRDDRANPTSTSIASYVTPQQQQQQQQQQPQQKPEWKRYKLYTRDEIMAAIDAVRSGMSALSAARKFHVPSRTLYDKVKKLGIATSRPFKRGTNGSSACFPFRRRAQYPRMPDNINNNSALLEASTLIKHAFDNHSSGEEKEALAAMAAAAAAHAVVASGHSAMQMSNIGRPRTPSPIHRTTTTMLKYMDHNRITPSPPLPAHDIHFNHTNGSSEIDQENDMDPVDCIQNQVEDLSIRRKNREVDADTTATSSPPAPVVESGVIMPPMNHISTIIKKEHFD